MATGAAMLLVGACAHVGSHASSQAVSSGTPVESPLVEPEPNIVSDRLDAPFTYDDGFLRFDPPPDGFSPAIMSSDAYQAFLDSGVYPGVS